MRGGGPSAVRGRTESLGVTSTNTLVNIGDFFAAHVVPELQAPPAPGAGVGGAVLKADALKFVTTFRSHLPKTTVLQLLPNIIVRTRPTLARKRRVSAAAAFKPPIRDAQGRSPRL